MSHRDRMRRRGTVTGELADHSEEARAVHGDLDVRIEQLIVDAVGPGDRYPLGASVQCELGRLLGEHGVPRALMTEHASSDHLAIEIPAWTPGAPAARIGRTIAAAVYDALNRPLVDRPARPTTLGSGGLPK